MRRHISAIAAVWLVFGGAAPAQVAVWEDVTVDYGACEAQLQACSGSILIAPLMRKAGMGRWSPSRPSYVRCSEGSHVCCLYGSLKRIFTIDGFKKASLKFRR